MCVYVCVCVCVSVYISAINRVKSDKVTWIPLDGLFISRAIIASTAELS